MRRIRRVVCGCLLLVCASTGVAVAEQSIAAGDSLLKTYSFALMATGEVLSAFDKGGSGSPATGSLGVLHYATQARAVSPLGAPDQAEPPFQIQIARIMFTALSSSDTVRNDRDGAFAAAVRIPDASRQGTRFQVAGRYELLRQWDDESHQMAGGYFYLSHGIGTWRRDSTLASGTRTEARDVSTTALGVGCEAVLLNSPPTHDSDQNSFQFKLGVGWAWRWLHVGDAQTASLVSRSLGASRRHFNGPEFRGEMNLRQLSAVATVPVLRKVGDSGASGVVGPSLSIAFRLDEALLVMSRRYGHKQPMSNPKPQ